jgi:hypothetical protein
MLKQQVLLEIVKEDRIYQFQLPVNAPLGEVHDVLFQMRSYIIDRINESMKMDQPTKKLESNGTEG